MSTLENLPLTNSSRTSLTGWAQTVAVQSPRAQTPRWSLTSQNQKSAFQIIKGERVCWREADLVMFSGVFFFYQINTEESFFCGVECRNTGSFRLVRGILAVSREQYEAKEMMKWDVNVTQTIACGDRPPVLILLNIKEVKNNNVHVEQTCAAADITVSSFPLPVMDRHVFSTSVTFMHAHALMGQTESCVPQSPGESDRTVSCLRCRFIIRHQRSSLGAQCYWTALNIMDSICREEYGFIYTAGLNAQIRPFDCILFIFFVPPVYIHNTTSQICNWFND